MVALAALGTAAVAGCGGGNGNAMPPPAVANPGATATTAHAPGVNARIRLIDVAIRHDGFHPRVVPVRPGVPVRWTNRDKRTHTVTSTRDSPQQFDSGPLAPGESFRITTKRRGRFTYRSTTPGDHMKGRVESG